MVKELAWESDGKTIIIKTLEELLEVLINIPQNKIDKTMSKNKSKLPSWISETFPQKLDILAHIKEKEVTPQQLRERLVRDLEEN